MKLALFFAMTIVIFSVNAECVHEQNTYGINLTSLSQAHDVYIQRPNKSFELYNTQNKSNQNIAIQEYKVQLQPKSSNKFGPDFKAYNNKHIKYYRYQHMIDFMKTTKKSLQTLGYETVVIGKSIGARDLYSVRPVRFDPNKKTILMLGRHHGDEHTANWIIEGYIEEFLKENQDFHNEFQLVLYPMINPDGAEAKSRYNSNGHDLNRGWHASVEKTLDEAKIIHKDLKNYLKNTNQIAIALDMHGSLESDFIYRVGKTFVTPMFYQHQQNFIDELKLYDSWQNGIFKTSNGAPGMARIVMINNYSLHALTHETPKNIYLANPAKRSLHDLYLQGVGIHKSIIQLY